MQIHLFDTPEQAGIAAALMIGAQILNKPQSILGLATGSTPIPAYRELIRLYREGVLDFSSVTTFNLDEYCSLSREHPCSYYRFMQEELFEHINVPPANVHVPNGNADDIEAECSQYDEAIRKAGGIDFQLLGIGHNGHIGFNEPYDQFVYGCHRVKLTKSTIEANRRFFNCPDEIPHEAISMGIGGIMEARHVALIATGADKAPAVCKAIREDINPEMQASILRTHPSVVYLLDKAAASML